MKPSTIIFFLLIHLVFLIEGCSQRPQKVDTPLSKTVLPAGKKLVPLSHRHVGFWVSQGYLDALKQTQSTKKAGEMDTDDFYRISSDHSIMRMNAHEGAGANLLLMFAENEGQIFSSDTMYAYDKVNFQESILTAGERTYIKALDSEKGLHELVNQVFIAGTYLINDQEVILTADGNIIGIDSVLSYKLNLDYIDFGMQLDKIYFQELGKKGRQTYIYEMNKDTLLIFELECETIEDGYCVEIEKGELTYKWVKQ